MIVARETDRTILTKQPDIMWLEPAAVTINIKSETERLVQEEIRKGHFESVDQLIVEGVHAWRERRQAKPLGEKQRREAVDWALTFAKNRAAPLGGISIKELIHEGHRL